MFYDYDYISHLVIDRGTNNRRVKMRLPVYESRLELHRHGTIFEARELYNALSTDLITPMTPYFLKKKFQNYVFSQY